MNRGDADVVLQPIGKLVLVPLRGPMHDNLAEDLRDRVLDHLHHEGAQGIVLDMAGVEVLDLHDFETLRTVVESATLMGAPVVLAGVRPGVAAGLTMLDVDDHWVRSTRTVEQAMAMLS